MAIRALFAGLCPFVLVACMSFPDVQDGHGHHIALSWSDLAEINRLIERRKDIRKPITQIVLLGPDYAEVSSGLTYKTGDFSTTFSIRKKDGKWIIDEASIMDGPVRLIRIH